MRAASWEPSVGNLATFLSHNTLCTPADLFTITLVGGTVLRYTSLDQPITVNGNTFTLGPSIKRSKVRVSVGIRVDNLTIELAADASVLVGGVPIIQALKAGAFDGARVLLERAFYDTSLVVQGTVALFSGRVGQVQASRSSATIDVLSDSELLDVMVPGEVYQPGCRNSLFDAQCTVVKASYSAPLAASTVTDAQRSTFSVVGSATANYYEMGVITFTSGANNGLSRTIKSATIGGGNTAFTVISPWTYAVAIGDTFVATPGCDKTYATCGARFANTGNFRGEPEIPAPETVI
ncbi:MAG: DUF2163 domain-containing protein [Leptothrix sp. (in: b-proteobacteria)]